MRCDSRGQSCSQDGAIQEASHAAIGEAPAAAVEEEGVTCVLLEEVTPMVEPIVDGGLGMGSDHHHPFASPLAHNDSEASVPIDMRRVHRDKF
jgi:hypothetical protein